MKTAKVLHRGNGKVLAVTKRGKIIHPNIKKLDLSYGDLPPEMGFSKPKGFLSEILPWNIPTESVEEAYCAYMLNRIPGAQRMAFMAEVWRVLIPNGKCTVIVPYWASPRAIQDPNSQWPPMAEQSFLYFNKTFREQNKIKFDWNCDFDFVYGYTLDPETANKSDEVRAHWIKHFVNAVADLSVTLTKRPK